MHINEMFLLNTILKIDCTCVAQGFTIGKFDDFHFYMMLSLLFWLFRFKQSSKNFGIKIVLT